MSAQVSILTERYDPSRTGANLNETVLNASNVNVNQFGLLYHYAVDGSVQAQPLYVPNVTIPGKGTYNVIYVVTMNDVVYAFNADSASVNGGVLWSVDFRNPSAGVTPIPMSDIDNAGSGSNIIGNVGIEGTPVISLNSNTMYLVARTKEVSGSTTNYVARLHALDITTGAERFGGPVVIQASVPGSGQGSSGGTLVFDSLHQQQRSGLALANGLVVFSWSSHDDLNVWHGWVMAYNATTLAKSSVWCTTPNGVDAGVWMSGRAPVVDSSGNVYYATGNGDWDGRSSFGDSVVKLSTTNGVLSVADYFTPDDYATLEANDMDLGSSGPLLIPGTNLLLEGGKESILYLMNLSNLGHEQSGNNQIVQHFTTTGGEIHAGPVFWNRTTGSGPTMYVWPANISLQAYQFNGSTFNTNPISQSTIVAPSGQSAGVLTVSANGSTAGTGIVWASMPLNQNGDTGTVTGILRAFDANNLTDELWDSQMNATRDALGLWAKYSPPTVVNGKVYMASFSNVVNVYGLLTAVPDFTLSSAPSSRTVNPGGSASYTVNVGAVNGFTGSVNLSVSGLPSGATGSFSPSSVSGSGSSTLTVTTTSSTPIGSPTLTITGTSGSLTHNATATLVVTTSNTSINPISIQFVGNGQAMATSETAGVVALSDWNTAEGASSSMSLADSTGAATAATVSWKADDTWAESITNQAGNYRMMLGYLDNGQQDTTTVTVSGLPSSSSGYTVYVYANGDTSGSNTGTYQISGTGITTTSVNLTYTSDFNGTFTQANNSVGNYVVFTIPNVSGFTLSAIPGAASSGYKRAPLNAIQIVPVGATNPNFTVSASPGTQSVVAGSSTTYTVNVGAVNGFTGSVNLSVSGLPSGTTGSFSPSSVSGSGSSTLTVTTSTSTPTGSPTLTITGTSGSLTHTATVTLTVTSSGGGSPNPISIQFVGTGTAMGSSEVAGVVALNNWNPEQGASGSSSSLVDSTGSTTTAQMSWKADGTWAESITNQAGNYRMMLGYLDNGQQDTTTVTVSGLPSSSSGYTVYVYANGDTSGSNTGTYQISGTGITTTSVNLTYTSDFNGTFTQANNSVGNYVVFTIPNVSGFTLSAIPGAASSGYKRAPLNAIQIVPN